MKVSVILPYYNRKQLLKNTLDSYQHFYGGKAIEVVVVDDVSKEENRVEDLVGKYDFCLKVVRLSHKNGINPCYPYNVGVRNSTGNVIVLSSPETMHTQSMFDLSNNFSDLTDETYLQFSVFCVTYPPLHQFLLENRPFTEKLEAIRLAIPSFYMNLGELGYPYHNRYGSWYTHSTIKPTCLNFLSAITCDNYYRLSGFDERFRFGTGYDDNEFRDRVLKMTKRVVWYDQAIAIHVDHEIVDNAPPTTNTHIWQATRESNQYQYNNTWGLI